MTHKSDQSHKFYSQNINSPRHNNQISILRSIRPK